MEVYDTANKLAKEITQSNQFISLKKAKEKLAADPQKKELIEKFEKMKQEMQLMEIKRQNNQEIDEEEKKNKLQEMYTVLIENKDIKEYFDLEIAFNEMLADVNKIIAGAIKDIL